MQLPAGQFVLLPLTELLLVPPMDVFIRAAPWLPKGGRRARAAAGLHQPRQLPARPGARPGKEIAVQLALGASRGSLVRRLLTETSLLGLLAGGAGVGLAVWLFTLGVSLVAGALLGLVPALQSTRPDVSGALRSESAGGQPGQLRRRNALVVAQLAISLVLLVGARLFLRSFQQVHSVDSLRTGAQRRPDRRDAGHPPRRGARLHAAPARPLPRAARRRRGGAPSVTCT